MYLCIDLKSFYASCECVSRNLNSLTTNLVVADSSRGNGALCLAVSVNLKKLGVKNRCRLYEIPNNLNYIIARPRMSLYIKYSTYIYKIYLKYVAKEDIHPYSIDEMFLDLTNYMSLYKLNIYDLAKKIITEIYQKTGIKATCGIGSNLYLAKISLDILAKHDPNCIGYLDEEKYLKELSHHKPLTDFWQIASATALRLSKYNVYDMAGIRNLDYKYLFKEFGKNAEILLKHAYGLEDVTIKDIKNYHSVNRSLSLSQILFRDYSYLEARLILKEMVETLILDLINKCLVTASINLYIGYSNNTYQAFSKQKQIYKTNNLSSIMTNFLYLYDNYINKFGLIRQIGISLSKLDLEIYKDINLLSDLNKEEKEHNLLLTINKIKNKYGKNSLLKASNLLSFSTQKIRNELIGGHHE